MTIAEMNPFVLGPRRPGFLVSAAIWTYVAWQYLSTLTGVLLPGYVSRYFGTALALLILIGYLMFRFRDVSRYGRNAAFWALAFLAVGSLSVLTGGSNLVLLLYHVYEVVSCVAILIIFSVLAGGYHDQWRVVFPLVAMGALNAIMGTFFGITGTSLLENGYDMQSVGRAALGFDTNLGRAGGLRGENLAGAYILPVFVYGLLVLRRRPMSLFGGILVAIGAVGTAVSFSRTSAACLVLALLVWAFFLSKMPRGATKFLLLVLLVAVMGVLIYVVVIFVFGKFSNQAATLQTLRWTEIGNLGGRLRIWSTALATATESSMTFLIGGGPLFLSRTHGYVAHNVFLDVLLDYGLIGFTVFVIPIVWFGILIIRRPKWIFHDEYLALYCTILLGMGAAWLSLSVMYVKVFWIVAGLFYGRVQYLRRIEEFAWDEGLPEVDPRYATDPNWAR